MITPSNILLTSVFTAIGLSLAATANAAETYAPRVEFGARLEPGNRIIHGAGQDAKGFNDYAKNFDGDHQPEIYMTYIGLCKPVASIKDWGERLNRELAALSPAKPIPQIGLNITGGKDTGAGLDAEAGSGKFDAQIVAFANALAALDRPVFIRIGYEFEGKWNNYQPATFQESWKRVTRMLRERKIQFATVWCAAGGSSGWPSMPKLMEFYPGDEFVDWWGVDLFSAKELTHPQLEIFLNASRDHRKPVMIGEMTPRHVGVLEGQKSWDQWFAPMLDLLMRRPEIKATAYINWEWREQSDRLGFKWHDWGDARIEGNALVRDRWVQALSNPIYLHASRDGSCPLPPISPSTTSSPKPAFDAVIRVAKEIPAVSHDLTPLHDATAVLENPHKGWYHHYPDNHINKYEIANDADLLDFPGMDHLYIRLSWAYLEPKEGQYDWALIDRMIEKWTANGLGIAFRVSCKETSKDRVEQQFATPRWVMEAGAKGDHYRMGKAAGPDSPWEPVFDDPIFLQKLENFLSAFAARYDGKPWLRYVDIGSIGDWGEGHCWAGSRKTLSFALRKLHVDLHLKYFKRSQLIISDDYVQALPDPTESANLHRYILTNGISYRDDSIMVEGNFSSMSDTFTVRSPAYFTDVYPLKPTVLELDHYGTVKTLGNWEPRPDSAAFKFGKGKTGPDFFRGAIDLLHATYIGYHGYAHEWRADNPALTGELLNRCGYWYFLHHVELPETLRAGDATPATLVWENRGVAPAYHAYQLKLRLEGPETIDISLDSQNRRWLPSQEGAKHTARYLLDIPKTAQPGRYTLKLKLHSPEAQRDVFLALNPKLLDGENFYKLGMIDIAK